MNIKQIISIGIVAVAMFGVAFAAGTVSDVTAQHRYPWNGLVDLSFTITGDAGTKYNTSFVAKDVVGGTNLTMKTLLDTSGKALSLTNALAPGSYKWAWDAAADLPNGFVSDQVSIAGNAVEKKDLYMVIDLSGGSSATKYPVSYLDAVPSGGWGDVYRTTSLVLRRIDPGSFTQMGQRKVTLTKSYYIGVFEVTQKQYLQVVGSNPAYTMKADKLPAIDVSYVEANTFLTKLTSKIGLDFSLPTEAQWEYACRAGTSSSFNNGGSSESDMKKVGRYSGNYGDGKVESHLYYYDIYVAHVGQYAPNNWGLYDMHGNAQEWVSDWYGTIGTSAVTDPTGPSSGSKRVQRGGAACMGYGSCTSSSRTSYAPSEKCMWYYERSTDVSFGFRAKCIK